MSSSTLRVGIAAFVILASLACDRDTPPAKSTSVPANAANQVLLSTISSLDSSLFDAYNRCDLKALGAYFAEDLEFYHDEGGLSRGREALLDAMQKNICGKVRRDLVPGTLVVYPLDKYGAVELGSHLFCDPRVKRRCDSTDEIAQFVTLWQQRGDAWTITRVISYDHHTPPPR